MSFIYFRVVLSTCIMVGQNVQSLVGRLTTSLKALDRILAREAEVSRLQHHVSVLSKRLHKLKPTSTQVSRTDSTSSPTIEEVILRSASSGKAVEEEGVAEEKPPSVGMDGGKDGKVADDQAVASERESEGSSKASVAESEALSEVQSGGSEMEVEGRVGELRDRWSDEDVVVEGKIVPLKRYDGK